MKVPTSDIKALEKWLEPRLGALVSHSEKVRELLQSAKAPETIIELATKLVTDEKPAEVELSPQQMAVWKAMLPILAEHGLLAVRGGGPALEPDRPLNKKEAAEFLGFGVGKLNRHMKKKQIEYKKYGPGKTAAVQFFRAELERFRQSRNVAAKKARPHSHLWSKSRHFLRCSRLAGCFAALLGFNTFTNIKTWNYTLLQQ